MKYKKLAINLIIGAYIFGSVPALAQNLIQPLQVSHNEESLDNEDAFNLKAYLGIDYKKLTKEQIQALKKIETSIVLYEKDFEKNQDKILELYSKLDDELRTYGIKMPYRDYLDFIRTNKNQFKVKDYKTAIEVYKELIELKESLEKFKESESGKQIRKGENTFEELYHYLEYLLAQNGFDPLEIESQIASNSIHLAIYDVVGGEIKWSQKSSIKEKDVSKEDRQIYENLWRHVQKLYPKEYIQKLDAFEVNTDGKDSTLAHVITETDDGRQWRLAVDLKDAMDVDGEITQDFNETLIHELMHIISLNAEQMESKKRPYLGNLTVMEGTLKEKALLNQFYQRFWKPILKDYLKATDEEDKKYQENWEAFQAKYGSYFVSDYAMTDESEDLAETFSAFVLREKPTGKSVADEKINFLYNYPDLIKIRENMRKTLKLKEIE